MITRIERFKNKIVIKYGQGILSDLQQLKDDNKFTLQEFGNRYGFTREYARQLFPKVFGFKYSQSVENKKSIRESELKSKKIITLDPVNRASRHKGKVGKGSNAELLIYNICKEKGFDICTVSQGVGYDFKINGYNVEIKSSNKTGELTPWSKSGYFRFNLTPKEKENCHYIIAYIVPYDEFYIIPANIVKSLSIYIRDRRNGSHYQNIRDPYLKYLNAWNLLLQKQEANIERSLSALAVAI